MSGTDDPGIHGPNDAEQSGRQHGQMRAERQADEREALYGQWTGRDLIDAVREAMDRGDEVTVHLPGPRTLRGPIVGVGRDYAVVRSGAGPTRDFAVRLGASSGSADLYARSTLYLEVHTGGPEEALLAREDLPPTFQAVLQQYDFYQQENSLLTTEIGTLFHPQGLRCSLHAHAGDHLYIRNPQGSDILMPTGSVTYIIWPLQR